MDPIREAQEYIEKLARRKGIFTDSFRRKAEAEAQNGRPETLELIQGNEELRQDHSKTLQILSADLYTNKARFLMEIIQNADDTEYPDSTTPTISITVRPDFVKIECNEIGFLKKNIEALCRTGQSSKSHGQGNIGEKGIGFKSVFKIAKRAHIRSPPYYFQLDQDRELGMIIPQWDKSYFDEHPKEHQTTIILDRICDTSTNFSQALQNDIESIDPTIILFLRRIRCLHLNLYDSSSAHTAATVSGWFRQEGRSNNPGVISLVNEHSGATYSFHKLRHPITFNGTEHRRATVSQSEIILAFPIKLERTSWVPRIQEQYTFAYLPIGCFGFKFIIQADFLTTSNRQSVDEDNIWNKNIGKAIPEALVNAVHAFNRTYPTGLRITWPLFMSEGQSGPGGYWRNIKNDIAIALRAADIIQTRSGTFRPPSDLVFLDWVHDSDGNPIFGSHDEYVSSNYPVSVHSALNSLGVVSPSSAWVFDQLQRLHNSETLHGCNRTQAWYSDLAKVVLRAISSQSNRSYVDGLRRLPLIPLEDGTWCTAASASSAIYLPISLEIAIPCGLEFTLVTRTACNCPYRVRLFKILGVKDCDVDDIVKRILDHHRTFTKAKEGDLTQQIKYLYKAKDRLRSEDMTQLWFPCHNYNRLIRGKQAYVDISAEHELQKLFSGYQKAHFLHPNLFEGLGLAEKHEFAQWLEKTAGVATFPRLRSEYSMHDDFIWLLRNKHGQVLDILRKHWDSYESQLMNEITQKIALCNFPCQTKLEISLGQTVVPIPSLLEKCQGICDTDYCSFLVLPNGPPSQWTFLSRFGVCIAEELGFYLWMLKQPGFKARANVTKAKALYHEIQSHGFLQVHWEKVQTAFSGNSIALPNGTFASPKDCVYHAPSGFSYKPALLSIYGNDVSILFRDILKIPFASADEVLAYLDQLKSDPSSTMTQVIEVYNYLQTWCSNTCNIRPDSHCIAVPSSSRSLLDWKTLSNCVWDDEEFSQNGLQIRSKLAIRHVIEQQAPTAKAFFTEILKLPNAGLGELLRDLELMQETDCDEPDRVYRLYERIQAHRRETSGIIERAFHRKPLIFLRGYNGERGRWLQLNQCIWSRSVLRSKYALMPTLSEFRPLIRDTLEVSNATAAMLIGELLNTVSNENAARNDDTFQYCKEILLDVARGQNTDPALQQLNDAQCWPCRTDSGLQAFCTIGSFFVNDRQDLFNIFVDRQCFLDFDFETSRKVASLLQSRGCVSFLSTQVIVNTETGQTVEFDSDLTQEYRERADALDKYFQHSECRSPYVLGPLVAGACVWRSANIRTHYKLRGNIVTKVDGGSSVQVSATDTTPNLNIFFSQNERNRDYALVTDFAKQLIEALQIKPSDLPDLQSFLSIPLTSLNTLLIRKGIISGPSVNDPTETNRRLHEANSSTQTQHEEQPEADGTLCAAHSAGLLPERTNTAEPTRSAGTEIASLAMRPYVNSGLPPRISAHASPIRSMPSQPDTNLDIQGDQEESPPEPVSTSSIYTALNRNRNRDRLRRLIQNSNAAISAQTRGRGHVPNVRDDTFDMRAMADALDDIQAASSFIPVNPQRDLHQRQRMFDRGVEEKARDFEVGFLGEQFVYYLLHDKLRLPEFSGEVNWTSSLRSRAGFPTYDRETSDFTYHDSHGFLTRYFQQLTYPYSAPEWLSTVCANGNVPIYRLEVKTTTSRDYTTKFYMSGNQYKLAKKLKVISAPPSEIYVVIRVSGLDVLEGASRPPELRVYLDPCSLEDDGVLSFFAPTYAVTAKARHTYIHPL